MIIMTSSKTNTKVALSFKFTMLTVVDAIYMTFRETNNSVLRIPLGVIYIGSTDRAYSKIDDTFIGMTD